MTLVRRERGPRCENCLKPIEVGQVVLCYDDAGEMHADCEHPYSTKHEQRDGEPAPVVLLGEPMVHVPLAALALPPSGIAEMVREIRSTDDPIVPLPSFRPQHLRGLALVFRAFPRAELWGRPEEAELAAHQVETAADWIRRLMEALKPFSEAADSLDESAPEHADIWESAAAVGITVGDLLRAREIRSLDLSNKGVG